MSIYDILDAIAYIYVNYVMNHTPIDNLPGLVRSLVPEIIDNREFSKLAA